MKCPFCQNPNTRVVDSRSGKIEFEVRRRRECPDCAQRFTTYERIERSPVVIVKKDNRREEFNREKITRGIKRACEKRDIGLDRIDQIVDNIERELQDLSQREIPSSIVGEKIISALKKEDDVAYVRFASVYREFADVTDFMQELKSMMPKSQSSEHSAQANPEI